MGASLSDFVAQCVNTRTPAFKRDLERWKSTFPAATIHVRFFILRVRFSECFLACSRHQIGVPMRSAAVRAIRKFLSTKHYPSVVAKILKNRSANARTSALRKSRMNKKARSHVRRR